MDTGSERNLSKFFITYIDNFILISKSQDEAKQKVATLMSAFASLGVWLELSKQEGPVRCLIFPGIELDTATLHLRLHDDKLQCLKEALATAESKYVCSSKIYKVLLAFFSMMLKSKGQVDPPT